MRQPRFTDAHRYPKGYRNSVETNVKATFARHRADEEAKRKQAEAEEAERVAKVAPMKRAAK